MVPATHTEMSVMVPVTQTWMPVMVPATHTGMPVMVPATHTEMSVMVPATHTEIPVMVPATHTGMPVMVPATHTRMPVMVPATHTGMHSWPITESRPWTSMAWELATVISMGLSYWLQQTRAVVFMGQLHCFKSRADTLTRIPWAGYLTLEQTTAWRTHYTSIKWANYLGKNKSITDTSNTSASSAKALHLNIPHYNAICKTFVKNRLQIE